MADIDRRHRADYINNRLTRRVAEVPAGLGSNEYAWMAVEVPSRRYMAALVAFEEGTADEEEVIAQGQKLLRAWQRAAATYTPEA